MRKNIFLLWAYLFYSMSSFAQIQRPDSTFHHIVATNVGYDYNLISVQLGYAYYHPAYKTSAFIDITQGTAVLGTPNLRIQLGLQTWQGSSKKFNFRNSIAFVYSHSSNKAGNYKGLGLNIQINAGFTLNRLGIGADFQYNPFFATQIRHTEFYRQYYYNDVKDGWYKNTANNLRVGGYASLMINKRRSLELSLRAGYQTSGQFDKLAKPTIYAIIGINKKF